MFRSLLFICVTTLAITAPADAAPIIFTGGEHGDYSRVVISNGASDVRSDRDGRSIDIEFSDPSVTFDFKEINDLQKAHRVFDAHKIETPGKATVRISLNCDCSIRTSQLANGKTVIDIVKPAIRAASHELSDVKPDTAPTSAVVKAKKEPDQVDETSMELARNRMINLLQKAADEGLITVRKDASDLEAPKHLADKSTTQRAPTPVDEASFTPREQQVAAPMPAATVECLPDSAFALDAAAFDEDPLGAISNMKQALAEAADSVREALMLDFSKGYIAIGFGDEALALLGDKTGKSSVYAEMARLVADRGLASNGLLLGANNCHGAHALWRAAALDGEAVVGAVERSGEAITTLPTRLRGIIAARIARKMVTANAWSQAQRFYNIALESPGVADSDLRLLAAELMEHDGRRGEAQAMLREVAAENTDASKAALLALAQYYEEDGAEPHEGFMDDIGALAMTDRGTEVGGEAAFVEAMRWAETGKIDAAVMLLKNAAQTGGQGSKALSAAQNLITDGLAASDEATKVSALNAFVKNRTFVESDGRNDDLRFAAAAAADAVGLPALTLQFLDGPNEQHREVIALKARAALSDGQPAMAIAAAAPYADEPEFSRVLIEANIDMEQNYAALASAAGLSDKAGKAALTANTAWRTSDWTNAARAFRKVDPTTMDEASAMQYALSAYMAGEADAPPVVEAILGEESDSTGDFAKRLFAKPASGSVVDRGHAAVENAVADIDAIRKMLSDG